MSFPLFNRLLLRSLALALIPVCATAKPCPPAICAVPIPRVELDIEAVHPSTGLVEHSPIDVTLGATLRFLGESAPRTGMLCVRQATPDCVSVTVSKDNTVRHTIHTQAPPAGAGVHIEAYYCETEAGPDSVCVEKSSAASQQSLDIAARYEVIFKSFEILHTRARQRDTVELSLAGFSGEPASSTSPLCKIVGPPTYCVGPMQQGELKDGEHAVRGDVRVGPFTLVPEADPDLNLLYTIANEGYGYNEKAFLAFMNLMNTFGSGIYSSLGKSGGTDLKEGTAILNNAMAFDCDGVVFNDNPILLNRTRDGQSASTLDARTRDNGFWEHRSDIQAQPNDVNCGDSSQYRATFRVARTSWQPPVGEPAGQERIPLAALSEENGPRYCPQGSAVVEVGCSGRYCDNLHLVCERYARETPLGHRDVDAHQWSGWYSEEDGGHPPGWLSPAPVTGFIAGVDCRGDYCDDVRVDTDATLTPAGPGASVSVVSEETAPARCPSGQFVTKLLCSGSYCDNLSVWCSP